MIFPSDFRLTSWCFVESFLQNSSLLFGFKKAVEIEKEIEILNLESFLVFGKYELN